MELLCPTGFIVHLAEHDKHGALEFLDFLLGQFLAAIDFVEYGFDFTVGIVFGIEFLDALGLFLKEVVTLLEGVNHVAEFIDFDS